MSFMESEGPPAKKRRFFSEKSDVLDDASADSSLPILAKNEVDASTTPNGSEKRELSDSDDVQMFDSSPPAGFDLGLFENFVGEKVAPDVLKRLREASGDDMEKAVNMYFDGSWKTAVKPQKPAGFGTKHMTINGFAKSGSSGKATAPKSTKSIPTGPSARESMPEFRYVGAFGVGAWATRSGTNLIKHGEIVRIERQKIQPKPVAKGRGRPPAVVAQPKPGSAAAKRVDVIVRFTDSKGSEVGRLPRETADWVSTLMDQKVCKFEGTCVYAPERVRSNDTIFLQLRCSLLRSAFDNSAFKAAEDRKTGMFEEKESSEEKQLRLRQVALVKLFEEVNLLPSRSSETTTKHKREGLLQAAEVAEQYEDSKAKEKKGGVGENGISSPPSEEAEDGKELEQDQLDTLYKKAQSFDFNAPAAEPAETFSMDLRHYQKQALHWMMSKEKNEKDENRETSMHPLWEEYSWPVMDYDNKEVPKVNGQDAFYVNPYSGELSLIFPVQEQHCLGGILADEMGLGKTIEMMSLIHSHKSDVWKSLGGSSSILASVNSLPRLPVSSPNVEWAPCTTLVVAPMSLLAQWNSEAENASKDGSLRSMVYYGTEKSANLQALCCEANAASAPNVIITSYGVILSEFNQVAAKGGDRAAHGGLFSLKYFRVILDEGNTNSLLSNI